MARFDKYEPKAGGYRASLGFAPVLADVNAVIAVKLDGEGHLIKSTDDANQGVICLTYLMNEGDRVDVMTAGEIVGLTGLAAGTSYGSGAAGVLAAGSGVGWTVEADRLVVRIAVPAPAGV